MHKTKHPKLTIRIQPDHKAWLEAQSLITGRSMTAEINALLLNAMKARPLFMTVRHDVANGKDFYWAALCNSTDDFFVGHTKAAAITASQEKLEQLGFPRARIVFEKGKPEEG